MSQETTTNHSVAPALTVSNTRLSCVRITESKEAVILELNVNSPTVHDFEIVGFVSSETFLFFVKVCWSCVRHPRISPPTLHPRVSVLPHT